MHNKHNFFIALLSIVLLVPACVTHTPNDNTALPDVNNPIPESAQAPELLVSEVPKKIALLEALLECIESVASLEPSALAAEIERLQSKVALAQTIPGKMDLDHLVERFSLACLLGRETGSDREWDRAQTILAELGGALEREDARQLVRYIERSLSINRQVRRHQSQLNRLRQQNEELENKIEQLKGLERDLEATNPYAGESDI